MGSSLPLIHVHKGQSTETVESALPYVREETMKENEGTPECQPSLTLVPLHCRTGSAESFRSRDVRASRADSGVGLRKWVHAALWLCGDLQH